MNKYLPIGSVVILKDGKRKLIIIGIDQVAKEDGKVYEYCSCVYPYGYLSSDELFLFNSDKIDKVVFEGYKDEELEDFYEDLEWSKNRNKDQNEKRGENNE